MAEKFDFQLVSPERVLFSAEVDMVVVPGVEGNFGVLKGHAPLLSTVRPGIIDVYEERKAISSQIFVAGGFAEVTGSRCTVLAEEASPLSELDRAA
ncbi:MAG: ATP synthase F1 subunit epsilon, partial [Pseudomonadota bacterium]